MAIIGIDLGTTNSAMAIYRNDKAEIIVNSSDQRTTASVVQIKPNGEEVIGTSAKKGAASFPNHTALEIKRLMGTDKTVNLNGRDYRPEEISSKILRYLKSSAEEKLGETVTEAVITVPAYFTDSQRKATKDAGELAGLKVERIINEPTAAALAFCHDNLDEDRHLLVYDLGGGTFDVSIVELFEGVVEVKSSVGDNHLGGTDFDEALIKLIKEKFEQQNGYSMTSIAQNETVLYYTLKEIAENVKIELSTQVETMVMIPFIGLKDNFPVSFHDTITRVEFENMIRPFIKTTIEKVEQGLAEANLQPNDISEVLMVGGSTRIPLVREAVRDMFGDKIRIDVNPDEVVATGAAVQAALKSGEINSESGLMAIDVCPYSLGVAVVRDVNGRHEGGFFDAIILKNTPIPTRQSKVYYTVYDNQTDVLIQVYQGEAEYVRDNILVSDDIVVENIPSNRAGVESVEITFEYDINGIMQITAKILSTGEEVKRVVQSQVGVMTDEERLHSRHRMEAENFEAELIENVKSAIHRAQKLRETASDANKARIDQLISEAEEAMKNKQYAALKRIDQELVALLIELV